KSMRHDDGRQDVDVRREFIVEPAHERRRRKRRAHIEVRHLRQRMHTGIGPSGAVQLEIPSSGDVAHRAIDFSLHGAGIFLNLPAAVPRAGILPRELETGHSSFYERTWDPALAGLSI